jgi:transglutaminase-like putative cysteine protease
MSTAAWPSGAAVRRPPRGTEQRLPVVVARVPAFLLLAGFGAFAWGRMVEPAAGGAMTAMLWAVLAAAALLVAVARRRLGAWPRTGATLLVAAALLLVALVAAGIPGHLLGPRSWDELAGGIDQGLGAVPNVRVPYHGVDEWTRSVIVLGGAVLVGLAALLAFAPRRGGAFGSPLAAATALTTLYLVPVMQRDSAHQFWSGAAFTLLLGTFLWLERVERRTAPMAAGVVAAAILAGLILGPGFDRNGALLDYEGLAQSLSAGASQRFDWNHDYAPLDARTGREVLRVRARHRAYWKAADLPVFDGTRWAQGQESPESGMDATLPARHPEWVQRLTVTIRSLTSSQFVAAGRTQVIDRSPRQPEQTGPGMYTTAGEPLKHGNAYRALVYTPRPTNAQLRAAARLPLPEQTVGSGLTAVSLPAVAGSVGPTTRVVIPPWGDGEPAPADVAEIEASPYRRAYDLARRLRASSQTSYAYMRAIERHLESGYTYSEDPKRSDAPLDAFLFGEKAGYCQQFSGAMALLLRLGGVPARVAAGFAPGSFDRDRQEYVVRDMDAHSWVEVYFPGIGWVTRDPTPADAPARSQTSDVASTGPGAATPLRDPASKALPPRDPSAEFGPGGASAREHGSRMPVVALGLAGALVAIGVLLVVRRRRRRPAAGDDQGAGTLTELRRALRRCGRAPSPQTTLETLAVRYRGTAAEGYLRALTSARYGYDGVRPTPAQRAALRRELASGRGVRGRLRAWWALPPQLERPRR